MRTTTTFLAARRGRLLAAILLCAPFAGCATLSLAPPDITLVNLEFKDLTLFETSGVFTVRLANENPEPLVVEGGVYNLYLGGVRVGKGLSDHRLEVPPLGTATDDVELFVNNLAVATRLRGVFDTGVADYQIKAKVYVRGSYGRRTLKVTQSGCFDFKEAGGAGPGFGTAARPLVGVPRDIQVTEER